MLLVLVLQYFRSFSDGDDDVLKFDFIFNKGDGCIFFCYGFFGIGKILMVEFMVEKLYCLLWLISVFEFGIIVKDLEMNLIEIFDIVL